MTFFSPYRILELSIISAQDLAPVARCMKTYALAWIHPERKLTTRVDNTGGTDPTWNDKFVFRVEEEILYDESSAIMIEIYALHWFKDIHVGTAQVFFSDIVSSASDMMLLSLQIQRASGRPKGILNIAVGMIDSTMQSVPLFAQMRFVDDDDNDDELQFYHKQSSLRKLHQPIGSRPKLRRTKSDSSSLIESELSATMRPNDEFNKKRKDVKRIKYDTSSSSFVDESDSQNAISKDKIELSSGSELLYPLPSKTPKIPKTGVREKSGLRGYGWGGADAPAFARNLDLYGTPMRPKLLGHTAIKPRVEYGTPLRTNLTGKPTITESELGPSASVVAAQIANEKAQAAGKDAESSIISVDEHSVEGLQSKLERWQADIPPVYDVGSSPYKPNEVIIGDGGGGGDGGVGRSVRHKNASAAVVLAPQKQTGRRREGRGLFSCFSSVCGLECSIVCGSRDAKRKK